MTGNAMITIRTATPHDAPALARLAGQLGYPVGATRMAERLAGVREVGAGEVYVAADAQDCVVGWTHVVPRVQLVQPDDAPFAELAGLVVDESIRGSRVGAALLAAAEDWARTHGFASLRVCSNVLRERAHRFYAREGYVRIKTQAMFRKALDL
jgi:GNAT superfamily N-acetyltransferase